MLDRFNFFDVYAYLLPGLAAVGLAWVPYLLLGAALPASALTSALALVGVAYVVGHALQTFAKDFWSSEVSWLDGKRRYPSYALLDDLDSTLSKELKVGLRTHLAERFKIDPLAARDDAFRLCRTSLKRGSDASYAEQFQGLYNFMRGCATALLLAAFYYVGWFAEAIISGSKYEFYWSANVCISMSIVLVRQLAAWRALFSKKGGWLSRFLRHTLVSYAYKVTLILFAISAGGALASLRGHVDFGVRFLALPVGSVVLLVQFVIAYHSFAKDFAAAVYRDYWALEGAVPKKPRLEPLEMD